MAAAASAAKRAKARPARKNKARAAEVVPDSAGDSGTVLLSISQAATEFGRDRATVAKRIAELGLQPTGKRRGYPVFRVRDLIEIERTTPD